MSENATAQVGREVALDSCGDARSPWDPLSGLSEEGLEVVLDQRIERRQVWDGAGRRTSTARVCPNVSWSRVSVILFLILGTVVVAAWGSARVRGALA